MLVQKHQCLQKFHQEHKQGTGINILTPKQTSQRLPIALSQVKSNLTNYLFFVLSKKKLLKRYITI